MPDARAGALAGVAVSKLVAELRAVLAAAGVSEAGAEARDLMAAVLDEPRFWPTLHRDAVLGAEQIAPARAAARARARGVPFAYAVGRAAFRHLTLAVDERVLIPRVETEQLVDIVLEWARAEPARAGGVAVDVGTGSGAIALALANEGAGLFDRVIGTDVSTGALAVARANADRVRGSLRVPVEFRSGSGLACASDVRARVIVSNPPYIAYDEAGGLPSAVRDHEPPVALFAGEGGMAVIARLLAGAASVLEPGGLLAIEVDSRRASLAAELALADGRYRDVGIRLDLAGRERFLVASRKGE